MHRDVPANSPLSHPSTAERRHFLRNAGLAVGAAWAAPTIVSATPAAAGVPSPNPCAPSITNETASCEPFPGRLDFDVRVPQGCPSVTMQSFVSIDGGPFGSRLCAQGIGLAIAWDLSESVQLRVSWLDACGGTVIQNFDSAVYPPCPPSPGAPVDSGATASGGTITVTRDDGTTETIAIP